MKAMRCSMLDVRRLMPLLYLSIAVFFSVIFLPTSAAAMEQDEAIALFSHANTQYRNAEFDSAIEVYRHLIDEGYGNKAVYFNLGNAYLQSEQLAQALWAFRHAEVLAPRDPGVLANLNHVRRRLDLSTKQLPWWHTALLLGDRMSLNESAQLFLLMLWLACLSGLIVGWFRGVGWRRLAGFLAGCALWSGAILVYETRSALQERAIVLNKGQAVHFAPSEESEVRFELPLGAEVRILDSKYSWQQVSADAGIGWVESAALLPLRPLSDK